MRLLDRGVQLYLLGLAFIVSLVLVWGSNGFVLDNTSAGTGWPLMIAIAVGMVLVLVVVRRQRGPSEEEAPGERQPWSSRE